MASPFAGAGIGTVPGGGEVPAETVRLIVETRRRRMIQSFAGGLRLVGAVSAGFLIGLVVLDGTAVRWWSDLGLAGAAGAATAALAWRARRSPAPLRRLWALTSLACGVWCAGQLAWSWQQLSGGDALPFPSTADVFYLASLPLSAAAVLAVQQGHGSRWRVTLDGIVAGASTLLAAWSVILAVDPDALDGAPLARSLAIAHPVATAASAGLIFVVATRTRGPEARAMAGIGAGWAVVSAGTIAYGVLLLDDGYQTGHGIDALYLAGFAVLALAGLQPPVGPTSISERRLALALPYLPLLVVAGAVATGRVRVDAVLAAAALVVVGAVLVRQYLALVENQQLARELERRVLERTGELARSEARYREALAGAGIGSFECDLGSGRVFLSLEAQAIHGFEPGRFGGSIDALLSRTHPDDAAAVLAKLQRFTTATEDVIEYRVLRADGEVRWVEARGRFRRDAGRELLVGVLTDISERRKAAAELDRLAHTDALTGLANRTRLFEVIDAALRDGQSLSLLLMDLDGFKDVNDGLGHDTGDRFLVEVADRLRTWVRPGDLVVRLGGDEFAVAAFGSAQLAAGVAVAQHLLQALQPPIEVAGLRLPLTASVGVAVAHEHGATAADLLRCADVAMYRAKQRGGAWALFDPAIDQHRSDQVPLLADLRAAIDADAIELHYQPQVHLRSGRVVAVEALARWTHPRRGVVAPSDFIRLAEHSGLIRELTPIVVRKALEQCRRWRAEGFDIQVAVNLSPRLLHDPELAGDIDRALLEARIPPGALILEITEGAFADETPAVERTLAELHGLGVRLAVDDFGAGYSSLNYLKRLPVDDVKLDRSFIAGLPGHADTGIVRAVLELARHLDLTVVAEGVESEAALADLRSWGCTMAQGFLIARPQPAAELTAWMATRAEHSNVG